MSTNQKGTRPPKAGGMTATGAAATGPTATSAAATEPEEDFYEEEFVPGEADGGMFGSVPAKKPQHFWPSAKRLMGLLKPERA